MLWTEIEATLMTITIFILNTNIMMFMIHPDGNVKKTVGVWDSVARFGLKVIKLLDTLRTRVPLEKKPKTKPQSTEAVME